MSENTVMNLFLLLCLYPILPVLYFMMSNETKPKKNIILGVTLPYTGLTDPRVAKVCLRFKKKLGRATLILAVIPLFCLLTRHTSISFTILMNWVLPTVIWPMLIYARSRNEMLNLKRELLSGREELTHVTYIDTQASLQQPKEISPWWYAPPILMGLVPVAVCLASYDPTPDGTALFAYITMALMPPIGLWMRSILKRQKPDVAGDNSTLNAAITRIRRRKYSQFCLWYTWFSGIFCLLMLFMTEEWISYFWGLVGTLLFTIAILFISLCTEMQARRAIEKLAPASPADIVNDEDRHWIGGILYYNPDDRHLMKDARIGIGTTMNIAHPFGKILMGFSVICLLSLPFLSLWMIGEEFLPLTCQVEENNIVVTQIWQECELPLEDIQNFEVIETLPSMRRISGSSIGDMRKGNYDVEGYGACKVYLSSLDGPFLILHTNDKTYLLEWKAELADTLADFLP